MTRAMQLSATGRAWLLELAEWFEQNAGTTLTLDGVSAIRNAASLRELAGDDDLLEELEAWYEAQEEK